MSLGTRAKGGNCAIKPPASKQPCLHLHRAALAVVKFSKLRLLNGSNAGPWPAARNLFIAQVKWTGIQHNVPGLWWRKLNISVIIRFWQMTSWTVWLSLPEVRRRSRCKKRWKYSPDDLCYIICLNLYLIFFSFVTVMAWRYFTLLIFHKHHFSYL